MAGHQPSLVMALACMSTEGWTIKDFSLNFKVQKLVLEQFLNVLELFRRGCFRNKKKYFSITHCN